MVSMEILEGPQTRTLSPLSTNCNINSINVYVLPVPGGPWIIDIGEFNEKFMASFCDVFNLSLLNFKSLRDVDNWEGDGGIYWNPGVPNICNKSEDDLVASVVSSAPEFVGLPDFFPPFFLEALGLEDELILSILTISPTLISPDSILSSVLELKSFFNSTIVLPPRPVLMDSI
ncbi:hypothetical protein WICPIJ_004795 [Wickerhamomyces pijperi]|uniref:Uncharacterized protein n=1 Tax=Wickerhamomyces pijperi TaxID=599730 RepID=A0A9P8Q4T4_WICPI|nr:hypothetical protein WICPIJ_004795 [Wickerhamomyces pijperi]